ncbi:MAG: DUF255 domain-containing protein [Candidatus Abyssobacteria bacterium SURF_5]|uniref:DUF255 domain-containing protein n=1 Tax=Abyssobacteria bacterium (strain SURF_5) TaxID=2093360 RepID=A0A3A4NL08_ABYX5|nr:MAG: DUF255 domain-containing protein [Candidatus Abyssubacteria bacterium SURF_5]
MTVKQEKMMPSAEEIAKLPPDGGPEFNRLIHEKSPYLLQHARNPVDWYPWSEEAFEKARKEDKPIFLSIGYSTCHWCHVMEWDSFEDTEVADILNRYYVCIKVDREERPDIDEVYMNATQLITNRGGWPNSVWLLPNRKPWYAGTFFPREDVQGRPGFKTILLSLAEFWQRRRQDVNRQADQLADVMERIMQAKNIEPIGEPSREMVTQAVRELRDAFDQEHGGFGDAPKFPPHTGLDLLFYEYRRTEDDYLLHMITRTLDGMAQGGIHDHLGGGFHRYSTDAEWLLPHFEKMLYDNALLARAYVMGFAATGNHDYREVAAKIFDWISHEMTDKGGGFYSALDADSEGVEGRSYVWTHEEVISALGEREGELFCRVFNVKPEGNFHEEATGKKKDLNVLFRSKTYSQLAEEEGIPEDEFRQRMEDCRRRLLQIRNMRVRPHLDDKVLSGWNGLMIGALAHAGGVLGESGYTRAADRAAKFVLKNMRKDGRLLRSSREGEARIEAYLDDYAFLIDGILDLYEATKTKSWLNEAVRLTEALLDLFHDEVDGGFYFTSKDHEQILTRLRDPLDKALPSGNGVAARVLVRLARLTGEHRYLSSARSCFEGFQPIMGRAPRSTESLLLALGMYLDTVSPGGIAVKEQEQPDVSVRKKPVKADVFVSKTAAAPGETVTIAAKLTIDKGWHINSNRPLQDYLIPTSLELHDSPAVSLGRVQYPIGTKVALGVDQEPVSVYEQTAWIVVPVKVARNAESGLRQLELMLQMQPCSKEKCLAPEKLKLSVPLEVNPAGGKGRHQAIFDIIGTMPKKASAKK